MNIKMNPYAPPFYALNSYKSKNKNKNGFIYKNKINKIWAKSIKKAKLFKIYPINKAYSF
jgi:hypothetical protein